MTVARTILRLTTWILVALGAIAIGVGAAIWLFVRTDEGRRPLARAIERELGREVGGSASLRIADLDFDGRVAIEDLVVRDPAGREVIRAARVSLRLDVDALLAGRVRVGDITITRPSVHIYRAGPSLSRKPASPAPQAPGAPKTELGRVLLLDGTAAVERPGGRVVNARVPWAVMRPTDGALAAIAVADLAPGDAGLAHPGGHLSGLVTRTRERAPWQIWAHGALDPRTNVNANVNANANANEKPRTTSFTLSATVAPTLDTADATVNLRDLDPRTIHPGAKPGHATALAVLRARGLAARRAAAIAGSAILRASGEYDGERVDDLLAVTTGSADASITSAQIASPAGQGRALLRLKRDGGVMVFDEGSYFAGHVAAIERWIPQDAPVTGSAEVEIRITGPVTKPKVEGDVRLGNDVMVNAGPLGRIRAQGGVKLLANGRLRLDRVKLAWSAGTLTVSGEVDPKDAKRGDVDLRVKVDGLDLAAAQRELAPASRRKTPIDGKLTATVDVERNAGAVTAGATGRIRGLRWRAGQPRVDVPSLGASLRGRRLALDAELAGRPDEPPPDAAAPEEPAEAAPSGPRRVTVELAATAPRDPFDGAAWGRTGADQINDAHATFDGDLVWLAALAGVPPEATGRAAGQIDLLDNPRRLAFAITASDLARGEITGGRIELKGSMAARATTIESAAAVLDDEPLAGGHATFDRGLADLAGRGFEGATITGQVTATNLPVSRLRAFGFKRDDITGRLTATIGLDGPVASPTMTIVAALASARIQKVDFTTVTLDGTLAGRSFAGKVHAREKQGGTIDGSGSWDRAAGTVDAKIRAQRFDLSFLRTFASNSGDPLSEIGGRLDAVVELRGPIAAPEGTLDAKLTEGTILLDEGVRRIERASLAGRLAGGRLDVSKMTLRSGRGQLSAIGNARLVDLVPVELHLQLEAQRMRLYAAGTLAEVDLVGLIQGRSAGGAWTVDAHVRRGTVRLPDEDADELQSLAPLEDVVFIDRRAVRSRILALTDLFRSRPAAPIVRAHVDLGPGVKLKSQDIDAVVDGALDLLHQGSLEIKGVLAAMRGTAKIHGHRCDVIHATAAFDGSVPADPALDILLTHPFRTATVSIYVGGTAAHPAIALTSDPSYDEAAVLALVLGGDADERALGDRPLETRAATLTTQLLADEMRKLIADVVRIDYVSVDLGGPGPYGGGGVEAGRWFGPILAGIRYRPTPEPDENTYEVQASIELWRRWIFDARGGDNGIFSGDFLRIWRW